MKTYILDTIDRFKRYSQTLDVQTILCQKAWYVLNEDGDAENLVFQKDGIVFVSINGALKKYTWQYIPQNQSLNIMHTDTDGTMLKPAYIDDKILTFQKIGTNECMFLIDDALDEKEKFLTLDAVKKYLIECEQKAIEEQKKIMLMQHAEERKKKLQLEDAEKERTQKRLVEKQIKQEKIKNLQKEIENKEQLLANNQQEICQLTDTVYGCWAACFSVQYDFVSERRDVIISICCIISICVVFISFSMACWAGFVIDDILTILAIIFTLIVALIMGIGSIFLKEDTYFYLYFKKHCHVVNKPLDKFNKKTYKQIKSLMFQYRALCKNSCELSTRIEVLQKELSKLEE